MAQIMGHDRILLIGQPGPLRDGLRYLLISMSQVKEVNQADDVPSVLHVSDEHYPYLVLLIANTSRHSRLGKALNQLQLKWPLARYIVMVDDEHDLQAAQIAGADKALFKGCLASKLIEAIELVME